MTELTRRAVMKGSAAAALITLAPTASAAIDVDRQACGCPRVHGAEYGHTCTIHDENGKRWDAYTGEDWAAFNRAQISESDGQIFCGCQWCSGDFDNYPPEGTRGVWEKTSYEYDEWEFTCLSGYRENMLDAHTTDWIAMAKECLA